MKIFKTFFLVVILIMIFIPHILGDHIVPPEIDLDNGYIIVEGTGLAPLKVSDRAQQLELARLAAKIDAQRNILEIIANLNLDSEVSKVSEEKQNQIKIKIDGVLTGAEIISESENFQNGVYRLKMKVQVKSLTPIIYPAPDEVDNTSVLDIPFSGLIIDAQLLNVDTAKVWEIRDTKGVLIYSSARALYKPGQSIFVNSMTIAVTQPQIGDNPLVVQALANTDNTLIIGEQDAKMLLNALQDTDVFLLSKIAVIIGGSKND